MFFMLGAIMRNVRHLRQISVCVTLTTLLYIIYTISISFLSTTQLIRVTAIEEYRHRTFIQQIKTPNNNPKPQFDSRFHNPCLLDSYDSSISDDKYYSQNKLIKMIEEKYQEEYANKLNRSVIFNTKTSSMMRLRCLPYYYILGSAKSGTTDLSGRLQCHRHITKPVRKEPMWFNLYRFHNITLDNYMDIFDYTAYRIVTRYSHSKSLFEELYDAVLQNQIPYIVGDHSSMTLSTRKFYKPGAAPWPNSTAATVKMITPQARFIIILRQPAERVYSYYKMHYAKSAEHFHEGVVAAIDWWNECIQSHGVGDHCLYHNYLHVETTHTEWNFADALSAVRQSVYVYYVKEWLQYFPSSNFLILKSEEYYPNVTQVVTKQAFPFLGLRSSESERELTCVGDKEPKKVISRLAKLGERDIDLNYNVPMLNKTRILMNEFYKPYNLELSKLLNDKKWLW